MNSGPPTRAAPDKGGARKPYAKAIARTDSAAILEGARRFAADPNLPEPQYIPHAATWQNGEGWTDEPLPLRYRPNAATGPERPNRLTPAEIKFAEVEALKDYPDPRILVAAGIAMPRRGIRELNAWDSAPAIEAS